MWEPFARRMGARRCGLESRALAICGDGVRDVGEEPLTPLGIPFFVYTFQGLLADVAPVP